MHLNVWDYRCILFFIVIYSKRKGMQSLYIAFWIIHMFIAKSPSMFKANVQALCKLYSRYSRCVSFLSCFVFSCLFCFCFCFLFFVFVFVFVSCLSLTGKQGIFFACFCFVLFCFSNRSSFSRWSAFVVVVVVVVDF